MAKDTLLNQIVEPSPEDIIDISSAPPSSSSDSDSEPPNRDDNIEEEMPASSPRALETQDILSNIDTQLPDFDFDLPPPDPIRDSSPDSLPSDPLAYAPKNTLDSGPKPTLSETQTLSDDDVDTYIARMIHVHRYDENAVISALKCTSMRPELAEFVLLEGKLGKGLPDDVPGIWSEEEDQVAEGGNAKALRGLEEKHGWPEVEARLGFLAMWREGDEDGEEAS